MAKISENIEGWFDRNSDGRGFRAQLTDEQRQTIRDQVKEIQSQGASWKKIRPTIKKLLEDWGIELPENRPEQGDPATSKDQESIESGEQELIKASNYPNPFNPEARTIPLLGMALKVRIFSTQGLLSRTLVDAPQSAGTYTVHWDGRDESGAMAASGSYFYQIDLSDQSRTQQMILMK